MTTATAPARKPVKSASDAPEFLQAVGVANGEWLFALKIYYEVLREINSAVAWRLAMILTPAAFSWGKWNQDYCKREGIKGPLNALLCIRELRDTNGNKTGKVEPYTPKTAADDAGLHKSNADDAYCLFEKLNLFVRTRRGGGTNGKVIWASTKPQIPAENRGGEETGKLSQGITAFPIDLTERIVALRELARKPFFSTFTHFDVRPDPQLVIYQGYCVELAEAMKFDAREAVLRARAHADEITASWRTKSAVTSGDNSTVVSGNNQNGRPVIVRDNQNGKVVIPGNNRYKEQVRREVRREVLTEESSSAFSKRSQPKADEDDSFETFQNLYPKDHLDPAKAKQAFKALSKKERQRAIERLRDEYLGCDRWESDKGHWIPLASNFLKDGSYNEAPPPALHRKGGVAPIEDVVKIMRKQRGEAP